MSHGEQRSGRRGFLLTPAAYELIDPCENLFIYQVSFCLILAGPLLSYRRNLSTTMFRIFMSVILGFGLGGALAFGYFMLSWELCIATGR